MKKTSIEKKFARTKAGLESTTLHLGKISVGLTSLIMYVFCLLCAIVIWANVNESSTETVTKEFVNIPITIEGETALSKNDMAVFDVFEETVSITFEGSKSRIEKLNESDIVAYVDVSEISEAGTSRLSIGVRGAEKLDFTASPASVKVFADEKSEIDVPIEINKTYSKIADYGFDIDSDIDTVTVSGAKSVLERVKKAVANVDLGWLNTSLTKTAPLSLVDENDKEISLDYVSVSVSNVRISVEVYTEKTVPLTYSYLYGYIKPENISVTLTPSEIRIKGDPTVLENIDSVLLNEIDETKLTGDTFSALNVSLPAGVTAVDKNEINEDIKLIKTEKNTVTLKTSSINVIDPKNCAYEFVQEEIELEYIVSRSYKSRVSASNFEVTVDLTDCEKDTAGIYRIPLTVTVKDASYTLFPINIGQIEVRLLGAE